MEKCTGYIQPEHRISAKAALVDMGVKVSCAARELRSGPVRGALARAPPLIVLD